MNFNIIGYLIYITITTIIILKVGKICYKNGMIFVASLLPNHLEISYQTNKILLLGYYLMNIGYCAMTLISWNKIENIEQLVEIISSKTALIILAIASMHYLNIFIISKYIQKLIN